MLSDQIRFKGHIPNHKLERADADALFVTIMVSGYYQDVTRELAWGRSGPLNAIIKNYIYQRLEITCNGNDSTLGGVKDKLDDWARFMPKEDCRKIVQAVISFADAVVEEKIKSVSQRGETRGR